MTLIVALACCNGLVMASESQATTFATGTPVRQRTSKIKQCHNSPVIWSAAGDVSIIQKIEKELDRLTSQMANVTVRSVVDIIKNTMVEVRREMIRRYRSIYGPGYGDREAPSATAMVVGYEYSLPIIILVDADGDDMDCQEFGFAAIGIGAVFAHSILHNHDIGNLTCGKGQVLAYKTIKEAIEVGAFGLGEPIDVWIIAVEADNKRTNVKHLPQEEVTALADTYDALRTIEVNLFKEQKPADSTKT